MQVCACVCVCVCVSVCVCVCVCMCACSVWEDKGREWERKEEADTERDNLRHRSSSIHLKTLWKKTWRTNVPRTPLFTQSQMSYLRSISNKPRHCWRCFHYSRRWVRLFFGRCWLLSVLQLEFAGLDVSDSLASAAWLFLLQTGKSTGFIRWKRRVQLWVFVWWSTVTGRDTCSYKIHWSVSRDCTSSPSVTAGSRAPFVRRTFLSV